MSNLLRQAMVATLCDLDNKDSLLRTIFSRSNIAAVQAEAAEGAQLSKADLMAPMVDGGYALATARGWSHFSELRELLAERGERFDRGDFLTKLVENKTLLEWAEKHGHLPTVFAPDQWVGHRAEMEQLWYSTSSSERKHVNFNAVREEVARMEGKPLREAQLADAGIASDDMRRALKDGKWKDMHDKLVAHGDRLRKEDLLLAEGDGDIIFFSSSAWDHVTPLFRFLHEQGDRLTVDDFLFKRGTHQSMLQRAVGHKVLHKVFDPELWVGRGEEMRALYEHVPVTDRSKIDFAKVEADVLDASFGQGIRIDASLKKDDLLMPLGAPDAVDGSGKLVPLALRSVWEKIDALRDSLAAQGDPLTLSDLRAWTPDGKRSLIFAAVQHGKFDTILDIAAKSGDSLTAADLTADQQGGTTLAAELAKQGRLKDILQPAAWVGRMSELQAVLQAVPSAERTKLGAAELVADVNRRSLRMRHVPVPRLA